MAAGIWRSCLLQFDVPHWLLRDFGLNGMEVRNRSVSPDKLCSLKIGHVCMCIYIYIYIPDFSCFKMCSIYRINTIVVILCICVYIYIYLSI